MIKDSTINSFKIFTKVGCRIIKVFELDQQDRSCSQCRRETIIAQEGGALFFQSHICSTGITELLRKNLERECFTLLLSSVFYNNILKENDSCRDPGLMMV